LLATYTDDLELHHAEVTAQRGAAFAITDAANLELDDVASVHPLAGEPVIRLTRSPGAILRNTQALPGTGVFLSTEPGGLRTMHLEGNVLRPAAVVER
jgi:hypothetical protein